MVKLVAQKMFERGNEIILFSLSFKMNSVKSSCYYMAFLIKILSSKIKIEMSSFNQLLVLSMLFSLKAWETEDVLHQK